MTRKAAGAAAGRPPANAASVLTLGLGVPPLGSAKSQPLAPLAWHHRHSTERAAGHRGGASAAKSGGSGRPAAGANPGPGCAGAEPHHPKTCRRRRLRCLPATRWSPSCRRRRSSSTRRRAFLGLDKITEAVSSISRRRRNRRDVVQFGALRVKTDACYTRPATEAANTDAFVEVDEITLQGEVKRIFSGWMFAASPGLHGVEHPDLRYLALPDCKGSRHQSVVTAQPDPPKCGSVLRRRLLRSVRRRRSSRRSVRRRSNRNSSEQPLAATAATSRSRRRSNPAGCSGFSGKVIVQRLPSATRCHARPLMSRRHSKGTCGLTFIPGQR